MVGMNHSRGSRWSIASPNPTAPMMMLARYVIRVFLPITLFMTSMLAILQAGPAISRTKAAPGVNPLSIRATAIGILPVAHRYIGIEKHSTSSMLAKELSLNISKNESGTNTVIRPATIKPIISHLPISSIISRKA